jgi:hypothetical protein
VSKPDDDGPALVVRLPQRDDFLPEMAQKVTKAAVAVFSKPSARAGLGASMLFGLVLVRAGLRPFPAALLGVAFGTTVERLYQMAEDVHETAIAQREYLELQGRIAEEKHSAAGKV